LPLHLPRLSRGTVRAFVAPLRSCEPRPFLPFRVSVPLKRIGFARLLCPLLTSDARSPLLADRLVRVVAKGNSSRTHARPPRLSLSPFVARPPDLQHWPSMDGGLRRVWAARPTSTAYYPIPVRQAATLLHAAFRPRLATTPLRFANPSPPSSWIRDFHPQVGKHAWQTKKAPARMPGLWVFLGDYASPSVAALSGVDAIAALRPGPCPAALACSAREPV